MKRCTVFLIAISAFFQFAGCKSESSEWTKATTENTVDSYSRYLSLYPEGQHAADAKREIDRREEPRIWEEAVAQGTPEGYLAYHDSYPTSDRLVAHTAGVESKMLFGLGAFGAMPSGPPKIIVTVDSDPVVEVRMSSDEAIRLGVVDSNLDKGTIKTKAIASATVLLTTETPTRVLAVRELR